MLKLKTLMHIKNKGTLDGRLGFTIVELIIVVVVIGILLTLGIGSFTSSQNRAKKEEAIATAEKVKVILGSYFSEKDRYPKQQSTVISYLTSKGDTKAATALGDATKFVYAGTTASGGSCDETGANRCEKYTLTIRKTIWNGGGSESDEVIRP